MEASTEPNQVIQSVTYVLLILFSGNHSLPLHAIVLKIEEDLRSVYISRGDS